MSAAAGTVDLSLPDYPTLATRAGVDPREQARRVATADPEVVRRASATLGRAGGELDVAYSQSMGAADTLGAGFTHGGAAVLDRATHVAHLPPGFGDAGTRLAGVARRLGAVADDLSATMTAVATAVSSVDADLAAMQSRWFARVAAAEQGGLIPQEAIPGLLAERDRVVGDMTARLAAAGTQVTARIATYETVVDDALRLLADQGLTPVGAFDHTRPPPPPPPFAGEVDPSGLGLPLHAGYAADPVNTALGNFVQVETDLPATGLLAGLTVARTYNSRGDADPRAFGARWSSWATTRLVDGPWTADYAGPDGQRARFPRTGPGFARVAGVNAQVERRVDGLTLAWFDGRRWDFDAAGRPLRTWGGPGTAVRFGHDAGGRLVELVHERGRRVRLEWAGDRVVAAGGSDGRAVSYGYDAGRLVAADGPAGPRRYGHDAAGRVASVTDADGVTELVNTYDGDGRVLTQRSPFGRTVTFSYAADGVTVVADDSAGPTNVYRHDHAGRLVAVTDGHGHTLHKRYDAGGNPVEIVDRGGATWSQEFDGRARLVRRSTPSAATYAVSWDDADRITAVTVSGAETGSATTRFSYTGAERSPSEIVDPEGGVTRLQVADGVVHGVTDADGVTVRLVHDVDGHLVEAVDAAGGVARVERDAAGRPTAVVTPAGRRTELVHDAAGRLVERRDPAGGVWRHEYSPAGRPTAVVDPTGARTEVRYGPHGEPAELLDPLGAATTRRYDDLGNLADLTTSDGAKWAFRHDALSRLTAWTDPAGGTWWQDHDVDGRPTVSTDPTGVRTRTEHDPAGRVTAVDDGLVGAGLHHDELGRLVAQTRADGSTRTLSHDRCGRLVTETGFDGGTARYAYSPAGRLRQVVTPAGRTEHRRYDARGRLVTRVDGNGEHWHHRHDADGLLVATVSPAGLVESLTRDAAGRVVRHRVPGRGSTGYAYDPAGRVVAVTDRRGRRTFTRDLAGRVVAATDALGHTTRYTWDARGNLVAVTDPLGGRTTHTYDEAGRCTAVVDPLGRTTAYRYDAAGRPVGRDDPTGVRRGWTHDPSGRTATATATADGVTLTIAVARDALGRPTRVTETGAPAITLCWDAGNRLVERRSGERAVRWSYDPDGLRSGLTGPDGTRTGYRRDGAGRVTGLDHPLLGPVALERDRDGRLHAMNGAGAGARSTSTEGALTRHDVVHAGRTSSTRLHRDDHGRVVTADTDGRRRRFRYDAAGQLVAASDPGSDSLPPGAGDRTYAYDPCGRLSAETGPDGTRRHHHDAAGQLVALDGPDGSRRFRYDAAGRRVAEEDGTAQRRYRYDGWGRPAGVDTVVDGRARSTALRVDALGELAQVGDVELAWDSADPWAPLVAIGEQAVVGHGHPWALADATTGDHQFLDPDWQHGVGVGTDDPWGSGRAAGVGAWLGYRGELVVDGLVWLRARAYDPATRAFLAPDPLPPVVGTASAANPYHYAANDPVNSLDPLGLRPVTDAQLEGRHDTGGGLFSTIGHGVLDVAGLVPGVGAVADVANAAWYAYDGDYTMAALSLATAVPVLGAGALAAKGALKGARAAEALAPTAEAVVEGLPTARNVIVDTNAVYNRAGTLAQIGADEQPVITRTVAAELRNNAAAGKLKMPGFAGELPVIDDVMDVGTRVDLRGDLASLRPNQRGLFGDGSIGATAVHTGHPVVTSDKNLATVLRNRGVEVRVP